LKIKTLIFKNYKVKLTKAGFIYILITIFIGVAAINTGNNLLYVMVSFLLSFMLLSGWFSILNLSGLKIKFSFPEEIYAKKSTILTAILINRKKFFPSFMIEVDFEIKDKEQKYFNKIYFPLIEKQDVKTFIFIFKNRGIHEIINIKLCSPFPFNFFLRTKRLKDNISFLVFPAPLPCEYPSTEDKKDIFGKIWDKVEGEKEFKDIKEYTPGIPKKFIAWKRSTGAEDKLFIKIFFDEKDPPVIIDFEKIKKSNLEEKISCATYLILKSFKENRAFGLKLKNKFFKPEYSLKQKYILLKELALYEST